MSRLPPLPVLRPLRLLWLRLVHLSMQMQLAWAQCPLRQLRQLPPQLLVPLLLPRHLPPVTRHMTRKACA
jgi:hypothetical protein